MAEERRIPRLSGDFEKEMEFLYNSSENGIGVFARGPIIGGRIPFTCRLANPQLVKILAVDGGQQAILDLDFHQVFTDEQHAVISQVIEKTITHKSRQEALVTTSGEGEHHLYKCVCNPFIEDGEVTSLVLTLNYRMANQPALYHPDTLVNALQDAVFIFDVMPDGQFRLNFLNQSHQQSTGLKLAEHVGKTPMEMVGFEAGTILHQNYQRCIDAGKPILYEEYLLLPRGNQWWQTKLVPIFVDGQPRQILGVSREITALKEREEEIRRLLGEYETIFNTTLTPMALWRVEVDETIRLVRFNRISEEQNAMPTERYAGKTLQEVFSGLNHDLILAKNLECIRTQQPVRFEAELETPRGTGIHVTHLAPLVEGGVTVGIVASSTDVTEERRRLVETQRLFEEYEGVFRTALTPMGIFSVDDQNQVRLIRFNPVYEREVGFTTDRYRGCTLHEILEEPYASRIDRYFQQCIRTQDSVVYSMEIQVATRLGYFVTQLAPIIEHGRVVKIIGSSADITELKHYQEELQFEKAMLIERVNERTEALRKAMDAKEEFLSTISTNLRQPLTSIIGFSELLRRIMDENQTVYRYANMIQDNAQQLAGMVDDLLSIARLENDQAELGYQFLNVDAFLKQSIAEVESLAKKANVTLSFAYLSEQRMFWIDQPRMKQLVIQVLGMGVQALEEFGGEIAFTAAFAADTKELHFRFIHTPTGKELQFEDANQHRLKSGHPKTDQVKILLIDHLLDLLHGRREARMDAAGENWLDIYIPLLAENEASATQKLVDNRLDGFFADGAEGANQTGIEE